MKPVPYLSIPLVIAAATVQITALLIPGNLSARPNVLLILTDNQSYHELGCHGHETVQTPNIDALSRESIDFTNFHAPPYCSPSRGLLLTGRYALRSGIHNTIGGVSILHQNETTIADLLQGSGYATAIFGKWHLGMSYPHSPRHRGFEETFIHGGGGIGQMEDYFGNSHLDASYWHNGEVVPSEGFSTDVLFDRAMTFIKKEREGPFFCFISTPATHKPWQVHPSVAKRITERDGEVKDLSLLSMIENIDDNVGEVLKQIDDLGLRENTLVILATDQGMSNRGAPTNSVENPPSKPFDARHHVFCMMRYPPLTKKPGRSEALTGMVDMAPTILDLCGVPSLRELDGQSLRPLLEGALRDDSDRELIVQCPRGRERGKWKNAVVKTQRWRLVGGTELYDLENGDAEVFQQHPDVVQRLRSSYDAFWNSLPDEEEILSRHPLGPNDTRLNGMDWYQGGNPWNRGHMGRLSSGVWAVDVVKDGRYRFELRRFPREAQKAIGANLAAVKMGNSSAEVELTPDADHAFIELDLKSGRYDMETKFTDSEGKTWGAYFAYVSSID